MKKMISFLLAITLLLSTLPSMSVSVAAAGYNAQTVVNIALSKVGTTFEERACLAFVRQMFEQAYGFSSTDCCAYKYGSQFLDSTSRDNIPLGADVFFTGSTTICLNSKGYGCRNNAGHVGIYVGDGNIVHAWNGVIVKTTIDYVANLQSYQYRGWGYHGDVTLGDGNVSENPDDYPVPQRNIYYKSPVMTGDDVRWIQAVLRKLGYTLYCTQVDGSYGPNTKKEVEIFQADHGLTVDGSVGPATRALLKELWEQKKQSEVKLTSISIATPPQKTSYFVGDTLDITGLTLTASYSNGTSKTITSGFTTNGFDSSTPGTKTVNVTYSGMTASFSVTVKEVVADKHYTIAYDPNGGTGTMLSTDMVVGTPKNLSPNAFIRTGYAFAGWALDRNADTAVYYDKQSVNNLAEEGTVTLYAVWKSTSSATIRVNNTSAAVGQQVQIPVYIENTKVSALTFSVKFDPSVLKFVSESETAFGFVDVNTNNADGGSLTLACLNESSGVDGKIVVLTFDVLATKSCNTTVRICESDAYDAQDNPIMLLETEATVSVGANKLGDVNGDGKVNIIDARWLLQVSSGSRTLTDSQKAVADVNRDGKVNIIDARWLLQVASGSRTL